MILLLLFLLGVTLHEIYVVIINKKNNDASMNYKTWIKLLNKSKLSLKKLNKEKCLLTALQILPWFLHYALRVPNFPIVSAS